MSKTCVSGVNDFYFKCCLRFGSFSVDLMSFVTGEEKFAGCDSSKSALLVHGRPESR